MKKPPLDFKPGQVWEGRYRKNSQPTQRNIVAVDDRSVLWETNGYFMHTSTRAYFAKWAERMLQ